MVLLFLYAHIILGCKVQIYIIKQEWKCQRANKEVKRLEVSNTNDENVKYLNHFIKHNLTAIVC